MFEDDLFAFVLEQLAEEMGNTPAPKPDPLAVDSWIARSVMQKSIRRGMVDLALRAASTLITTDRRVLWKRLIVTAMEDLGVGEVDLLARIIAASRDRTWMASVDGEWAVVCHLIGQACAGPRCQAANDLWNIGKNDPILDVFKTSLFDAGRDDLLSIIIVEHRDEGERAAAPLIATRRRCGALRTDPHRPRSGIRVRGVQGVRLVRPRRRDVPGGVSPNRLGAGTDVVVNTGRPAPQLPWWGWMMPCRSTTWFGEVPAFALDQYALE